MYNGLGSRRHTCCNGLGSRHCHLLQTIEGTDLLFEVLFNSKMLVVSSGNCLQYLDQVVVCSGHFSLVVIYHIAKARNISPEAEECRRNLLIKRIDSSSDIVIQSPKSAYCLLVYCF